MRALKHNWSLRGVVWPARFPARELALVLALGLPAGGALAMPFKNGFDLGNAIIPTGDILSGGPPKDGIPAIDKPKFVAPDEAAFLQDNDPVVGVTLHGTARAYPLRILVWHELVNDQIDDTPFVVSYCPLCGTSMVFAGETGGERLTFGVSGLLYQSDVLMYDRQHNSLWSQLAMKAVSGPKVGTALKWLPSRMMSFKAWKEEHKKLKREVLSTDTGFSRNYNRNPYVNYESNNQVWFRVPKTRSELASKAWVIGIVINGKAKAYPISPLALRGGITDEVDGVKLKVSYDAEKQSPRVILVKTGEEVPFTRVFWFAWQAFYPDTGLWRPGGLRSGGVFHFTLPSGHEKDHALEVSRDLKAWDSLLVFGHTPGFINIGLTPADTTDKPVQEGTLAGEKIIFVRQSEDAGREFYRTRPQP